MHHTGIGDNYIIQSIIKSLDDKAFSWLSKWNPLPGTRIVFGGLRGSIEGKTCQSTSIPY